MVTGPWVWVRVQVSDRLRGMVDFGSGEGRGRRGVAGLLLAFVSLLKAVRVVEASCSAQPMASGYV